MIRSIECGMPRHEAGIFNPGWRDHAGRGGRLGSADGGAGGGGGGGTDGGGHPHPDAVGI